MPKKTKPVETEEEDYEDEIEQKIEPVKPKKKLTEKQLEALANGRKKGLELLKKSGEMTQKNKEVYKQAKQLQEQEKIKKVEELSKYADVSVVRQSVENLNNKFNEIHSKFESIDNRFSSYLTDREKRKQLKEQNLVEKTIKKELPNTMASIMMKDRIDKELSNNPFFGRV